MSADALETYLTCATALLLPQTRREVRTELQANLHQAMLDARLNGLSEADAWDAALHESGSVWWLALNLARVYTLGLALRALLVGLALGGAAYAVSVEGHTAPVTQEAQP